MTRSRWMKLALTAVLGLVVTLTTTAATPLPKVTTASATTPVVQKKSHKPIVQKQIWNLQNANIRAVIHTISAVTGKNFVINPQVQGNITIVSKKPMTPNELYQVFLSMLQVLNYAAVPSGSVIKIVPATDAKEYSGHVATKAHPGVGDEVVLRVVPVNNVSATQLVPILRPLMQEWGTIMAYNPSNALILAGSASNVTRLVGIIHEMDKDNATAVKQIKLKNANAQDLVKVLEKLQTNDRIEGKATNVSYAADTENNSILVSGSATNIIRATKLVDRLDSKSANGMGTIEVIHLKYLLAKNLVPILTKLAHGKVSAPLEASSSSASSTSDGASSTVNTTSPLGDISGGNSNIAIVAESSSNAIMISAPASTMVSLNKVIKKLDVRPMQVLVEAIIVNVNEALADKLGIQWGAVSAASTSTSSDGTSTSSGGFQQGIGFLRNISIKGLLTALQSNTDTDVLATPSIVVLNNQKATISDGVNIGLQNRSYATTDTGSNSGSNDSGVPFTTTERKNVALKLTVTPQISPNRTVMMKIDQSNQQVDPTTGTTDNPVIDTSEIKTGVLVNSGDILVLGGLIRQDQKGTVQRVPILGDIPLLGKLFTYTTTTHEKKNLLVFIKPIILNSRAANKNATNSRYNYIRGEQIRRAIGESIMGNHKPILPKRGGKLAHPVALPAPFGQ